MNKFSILVFMVATINLHAVTMGELFDAIKKQPTSKIDDINSNIATIARERVNAGYYPKVDLFASYTHYNSPTNLIPLSPDDAAALATQSLPFSQNIQKGGVQATIPLFIKELSDLSQRAKYLAKSAKLKKELNFYQNEALLLGSNASLEYLDNLLLSLKSTQKSLLKTKNDLQISVDSGRMPAIAIDKIDEKLNQLDISINNIDIKKATLISNIENLTGLEIKTPAKMEVIASVKEDEIFALKPLQEVIKASMSEYKATKAKRYYPKVAFNAMWSENYTQDDSRLGENVHEGYGYYQLGITMPLYNRGEDVDIELKKIQTMKDRVKLKKTEQELKTQVKTLQKELVLLEKSKKLNEINIANQKDLLKYAKVSFNAGRMSEEDYLIYEDGVLNAKSSYYETVSKQWQNIAKLAVIYGNDLKGVVR